MAKEIFNTAAITGGKSYYDSASLEQTRNGLFWFTLGLRDAASRVL